MEIKKQIQDQITEIIQQKYQLEGIALEVQQNKTDFEGDFTVVIFPLVKQARKSPDALGLELGEELIAATDYIRSYQVVKGFLNLSLKNDFFINQAQNLGTDLGNLPEKGKPLW